MVAIEKKKLSANSYFLYCFKKHRRCGIIVLMNTFLVQQKDFEGPLDLLLHLIEKRKLSISEVSLAEITDEYLAFLRRNSQISFSQQTYFTLIAASLILIKSKSLLPTIELSQEEEENIEELQFRIQLLQLFRHQASLLAREILPLERKNFFPRERKREIRFLPDKENMNLLQLELSFVRVLDELPELETKKKEASMSIVLHIQEMMASLEERIQKQVSFSFRDFIRSSGKAYREEKEQKVFKLVSFLAILELVKNGILRVAQEESFDDIKIRKVDETKI